MERILLRAPFSDNQDLRGSRNQNKERDFQPNLDDKSYSKVEKTDMLW